MAVTQTTGPNAPSGWTRSKNDTPHGWRDDEHGLEIFELRAGDGSDDDKKRHRDRSELKSNALWDTPTGEQLRFFLRLPKGFVAPTGNRKIVLAQIHRHNQDIAYGQTDAAGREAYQVLFQLYVHQGHICARVFEQDAKNTQRDPTSLLPLQTILGAWVPVDIAHTMLGSQQQVSVQAGHTRTLFTLDATLPGWKHRFKYGIYRNMQDAASLEAAGTHSAQFKNVRIHVSKKDTK